MCKSVHTTILKFQSGNKKKKNFLKTHKRTFFVPRPPSVQMGSWFRRAALRTGSGARTPATSLCRRPIVLRGHQLPLAGGAGCSGAVAGGGATVGSLLTSRASSTPPLPLHQVILRCRTENR